MTAQFALVHSQTLYTGKDRIMLGVYKTKINFLFPGTQTWKFNPNLKIKPQPYKNN